jgi:DNA-binding NarL/FixJ family response regulator
MGVSITTPLVTITTRQREVLTLLARGWTAAEIGGELSISTRTVRAHLDALRMKFGVRRCRELPAICRSRTGVDLFGET